MSDGLNEGVVGDTAKLMVHRLIVRMLRRDPSLVERAKVAHARQADQFPGWPFVREWHDLLELPLGELASRLISRDREMVRLRNTSPFYLAEGVDLGDYASRVRLRRAARRSLGGRATLRLPAELTTARTPQPLYHQPLTQAFLHFTIQIRGAGRGAVQRTVPRRRYCAGSASCLLVSGLTGPVNAGAQFCRLLAESKSHR